MKVETPKKHSLPSIDVLTRLSSFTLPPLLSLLSQPERPKLPSINTFTPSTPRFILPPRSVSETNISPGVPVFHPYPYNNAKPNTLVLVPETQGPATSTPAPNKPSVSNTSIDFEADTSMNTSMNDSMVKPATKRKASSLVSPTKDFAFISHSPATYPSQEPSIDNASLARRKRRRTSPHELAILNQEFDVGSTPNKARRIDISKKVNMTEKAVKIWFQNKRQSLRRLKSADKEITELPPTPDSSVIASGPITDAAPTPIVESTPIKPNLTKSHSLEFVNRVMYQLLPIRSHSTPSLTQKVQVKKEVSSKTPLLSKMLAAEDEKLLKEGGNLILNLTNKKQPDFVRSAPAASNQVMTFKLTPSTNTNLNTTSFMTATNASSGRQSARKPLGQLDTNTIPTTTAKSAPESQCVHSLLSLRSGNF